MKTINNVVLLLILPVTTASCSETLTCEGKSTTVYESPSLLDNSFSSIGAGQGLQAIDDYIYIYGDADNGTIQEVNRHMNPTGWMGEFSHNGTALINSPGGLAYKKNYPTFVGTSKNLYHINWDIFYEDQDLDRALIKIISSEGKRTKPEYVFYEDKWYVASTEYDADPENEVILMDPENLINAESINDEGVIVYRFPVSRFIQDIHWDIHSEELVLIQNVDKYRGWRLTSIDLETAVVQNSGTNLAVTQTRCILKPTELEGYAHLEDGTEVFLIADKENNLFYSQN